jgi:hypothetical protein
MSDGWVTPFTFGDDDRAAIMQALTTTGTPAQKAAFIAFVERNVALMSAAQENILARDVMKRRASAINRAAAAMLAALSADGAEDLAGLMPDEHRQALDAIAKVEQGSSHSLAALAEGGAPSKGGMTRDQLAAGWRQSFEEEPGKGRSTVFYRVAETIKTRAPVKVSLPR